MSVRGDLTVNRRSPGGRVHGRGPVENEAYVAFCARAIRAAGRRCADGDVESLALMLNLAAELDQAITTAVHGLRTEGYSWGEIADRAGVTKQTAHERWGAAC